MVSLRSKLSKGVFSTYIDKDMVDAAFALSLANISHPISGNCEEHL